MTEVVGAAKLAFTTDTSGVEAGAATIKRKLSEVGQAAKDTGDKMSTANTAAARSVDRLVQKAELAAATMNKGATEAKLYELSLKGATAAQLKTADAALKTVDALKKQEASLSRAHATAERFGAALAVGVAAAAASMVAFARSSINALDNFNDLADATGASIEGISALDRVARENGASFDTVSTTLIRFNKVLSDTGDEGKQASAILKALGLDADVLRRADPAEALRLTAVALAKFADDGDKARAVQVLFGKSVAEVAPLLKDLAEKTELTGLTSTQAAKNAETFNKSLFALKSNVEDLARSMVSDLIPALNTLIAKGKDEGFLAIFGFDKKLSDTRALAGMAGDVRNLTNELARLKREAVSGNDVGAQIEAVTGQLAAAKAKFSSTDQIANPQRAGGPDRINPPRGEARGLGNIPDPKGGSGSKTDPEAEGKRLLETLEKQVQKTRDLTVYETLLDDLQNKRLGTVGPKLREQLEVAARQVDTAKALQKTEDDATKARERNLAMQQQADLTAEAAASQAVQGNEQMREEIRLLGLEGTARAAVEQAILSETIARKDLELIGLRNADASATQINALEREITLLKERQGLIGQRGDRQNEIDVSKDAKKEAESLRNDLSGALQRAFEDTSGKPLQAFGKALASTIYSRVTKSLAESLADGLLKPLQEMMTGMAKGGGGGGFNLGGLLSSVVGLFSGGGSVNMGTANGADLAMFYHGGGVAGGQPSFSRRINSAAFSGARRFHGGGLASDEVPAILQRGEGVFTREQMKALGSGQSAPAGDIHIVNNTTGRIDRVERRQTPDGDQALVLIETVAAAMGDDNSSISRSLKNNFNLRRNR